MSESKIIKKIRYYDYNHLKSDFKFWLIFFAVITLIFLVIFQVIVIQITFGTQDSSFVYTILNALVWYVYLNALGIGNKGTVNQKIKYLIVIIGILLLLLGFGYFDVQFTFNFPFLAYRTLSLSSEHGIYFFFLNLYIFMPVFFVSFLVESEVE